MLYVVYGKTRRHDQSGDDDAEGTWDDLGLGWNIKRRAVWQSDSVAARQSGERPEEGTVSQGRDGHW